MMALSIGDSFSTFLEVEAAIKSHEKSECITYWKRDSRTIEAAKKRKKGLENVNPKLKYYDLKYTCVKGGREYKSTSTGQRPNQRTFRESCNALIHFRVSKDGQKLLVTNMIADHSHEITKEVSPSRQISNNNSVICKPQAKRVKPNSPSKVNGARQKRKRTKPQETVAGSDNIVKFVSILNPPAKRARPNPASEVNGKNDSSQNAKQTTSQETVQESDDIDLFLKSMAESIRTFAPKVQAEVMFSIHKTIHDAKMKFVFS